MATDRRSARRYTMRLPLRYRVRTRNGVVYSGTGVTQNISCKGIHFTTGEKIVPKGFVQLYLEWPVLSDGRPLELQIVGSVVRADEAGVAVRAVRHEFSRLASEESTPRDHPVLPGA